MTHTITAQIERLWTDSEGEERVSYPEIAISFDYLRGYPATGPTYSSGGEPACPAEITFQGATLVTGDGLGLSASEVAEMGSAYLDTDAGYWEACTEAEDGWTGFGRRRHG